MGTRFEILKLLPSPDGATRNLENSVVSGLRILGRSDPAAEGAHNALKAMNDSARQNLFNFTWSNLAELIVKVADEKQREADDDEEDEGDDEVEASPRPLALNISVTLDDEAALALNTLIVAGAKTNAEVIGNALRFYLAALQHHAKQLDQLNEEEGEGY
jgi:hypothetical protein